MESWSVLVCLTCLCVGSFNYAVELFWEDESKPASSVGKLAPGEAMDMRAQHNHPPTLTD